MHAKLYSLIIGSIAVWLQFAAITIGALLLLFGIFLGGFYYYPNTFPQFFYLPIAISILGSGLGVVGMIVFFAEYRNFKHTLRLKPSFIGPVLSGLSLIPGLLALIHVCC